MSSLPDRSNGKTAEIEGIRYRIRRSLRGSCQIAVEKDGTVTVKMPLLSSDAEGEELIRRHQRWIRKRLEVLKEASETGAIPKLTEPEKQELKKAAKQVIPARVAYYAEIAGVDYQKISYRFQKTRWGSCTKNGNLSFNCLLMLAPSEVLDSVIVHELCHRKVMDHSPRFYAEVTRILPGYKEYSGWLKKHGRELSGRV